MNIIYQEKPTAPKEFFDVLEEEINTLKNLGVFANKKICILGSWRNAEQIYIIIKKLGLRFGFIVDNDVKKQGMRMLGHIVQPVDALKKKKDCVVLVINNNVWRELASQLKKIGLEENKEFFILFGRGRDSMRFLSSSTIVMSNEEWKANSKRITFAYKQYKLWNRKYDDIPIWLMHQESIGDLYLFSLFLPRAMGEQNIKNCDCVLVVTTSTNEQLARVLGFRYVERISYENAFQNWLPLLRLMGLNINVYNAVYHGIDSIIQPLADRGMITFRDSFTKYVFQFTESVEPIYPIFPRRSEFLQEQFERYQLRVGKTVIISPYAGHLTSRIPREAWGVLVNLLKKRGFDVCTNCGTESETPLAGTVALHIDLQDCNAFFELAGFFIGVRSGLCDLVCNTECKKIIIYEDNIQAGSIDFFGFHNMCIGKDIYEIINDGIHVYEMMDEIISMIE